MVKTNWTIATTNPMVAIANMIACIQEGYNAWIELRENGDQAFPIIIKNPELDNPFNWESSYGTLKNTKDLAKRDYFNETEKDLTYNWVNAFGTPEAIKAYEERGEVVEGLAMSCGVAHPLPASIAREYRKKYTGTDYDYSCWMYSWRAKEGIPYHIPDPNIGKVFTICYDDGIPDLEASLRKAAKFLSDYADVVRNQKNN